MITVNGDLQPYCEGCPYLDLVENELVSLLGKQKVYNCANATLCARLFRYLSENATSATIDSSRG
jgi:hypothetical protein